MTRLAPAPPSATLWKLDKRAPGEVMAPGDTGQTPDDTGRHRIRCPKCGWQPGRDARWSCTCGHEWHTFDTGGVCPACHRVWTDTQCQRCGAWSPHLAWHERTGSSGAS